MKNKVTSIFLIMVMCCQVMGFINAFATEEKEEGIISAAYFDDGKIPFDYTSSNTLACKIENNSCAIKKYTGTEECLTYPKVTFEENETYQVVSFDIKLNRTSYFGYITLQTGMYREMEYTITSDGYIVADWNVITTGEGKENAFKYESGKWYTLTAVFDREAGEILLYQNGIVYGYIYDPDGWREWPEEIGIKFTRVGGSILPNTMYIDNIEIGTKEIFDPYATDLNIVCEELGQAFWEKSVEFGIGVRNSSNVKKSFEVKAELVNDLGVVEMARTDTVELEAGERKVIEYKTPVTRYAVYDLNVISTDMSTGEVKNLNTEFVTIKKSEEQNPKMGINDHSLDQGHGYARYADKFEAFKNSGIKTLRLGVSWEYYEKSPGVYKIPDRFKNGIEAAKDNNMNIFYILAFNNEAVAPGEWAPHTEKSINAFGEYAYNLALETKENCIGYEVWNEWNVLEHFNREELPASAYIPIISEVKSRIEYANPDAKVYGLSGMTWNRTELYKEMAEEMFEGGLANYSDGYTIHSYYGHQSPDTKAHIEGVEYTKRTYGAIWCRR